MAVLTTEIARLHKLHKHGKLRKGVCIYHNSLGWLTYRTYEGITGTLDTADDLTDYINRLRDKGYEIVGEMTVPSAVRSQRETQDAIAND